MQNQLIIDFSDLQVICIECKNCKSQVRMRRGVQVHEDGGLVSCPVCLAEFDAALAQNVGKLFSLIQRMSESTKISIQLNADALLSKQ